jgi:hypothetical protein
LNKNLGQFDLVFGVKVKENSTIMNIYKSN